jgi:hypothetical protein
MECAVGPGGLLPASNLNEIAQQTIPSAHWVGKELFGALTNPLRETVVLVISAAGKPGRFLGYYIGDEFIVTSRQPFLDGARTLLARGYEPTTSYNMRHANSDALSFVTTTIGHAAALSVSDTRTPRFQKFVPFKGIEEEAAEAAE